MWVKIDDLLTANLSMPRSVITKLPFSPLVKNLDINIRFCGATIPAPALAPLLVCDHFTKFHPLDQGAGGQVEEEQVRLARSKYVL